MRDALRLSVILLLAWGLGACASTRFTATWSSPDLAVGELDGEKVAAFLISENESTRKATEDALARELSARGAQGIAGYTLVPTGAAKDEEKVLAALVEAGVQAVVTVRVVSEEQEVVTTPGTWHTVPSYRYWGGYWRVGWRDVYQPGHTQQNTVVRVETLIYRLDTKEMIWGGLSETTNPRNVDSFVKELAAATDEAIRKSKLAG